MGWGAVTIAETYPNVYKMCLLVGVRGVPERDISSLRTVAGEMTTQKNSSRRAAAVAPWKGYLYAQNYKNNTQNGHDFLKKCYCLKII